MIVKKNYRIFLFLLFTCCAFREEPGTDYRKEFGTDYKDAEHLAIELRPQLLRFSTEFNEDPRLMEAIVFPEMVRYNIWYDYFETGSLCLLYSRFGADYANFSIGYFQMKPEFAESIEKFVSTFKDEEWVVNLQLGNFSGTDDFENRKARVRRLQDPAWQLRYLIAFIKCCRIKHNLPSEISEQQEIQFLATAYNTGWTNTTSEIWNRSTRKFFHLEQFNPSKRYVYADISLSRYLELGNSELASR
jgi:hypothetical protein